MNDENQESQSTTYREDSLTLRGSIAMGTGVMIGAGIFALTGQVAEHAGGLFPLAFLAAAIVAGFSAYSYVKLAQQYPSAGGIAMFLMKAYGKGTLTAGMALLMYFSMVINESLVARTFGTYFLQLFDAADYTYLVPWLGVALLIIAFTVNVMGNRFVDTFSTVTSVLKISGILIFAIAGLWVSGFEFSGLGISEETHAGSFLAATALALLAFKGFTTITNSGSEIVEPRKNIGRSIVISLVICLGIYLLVSFAVAGNLSVDQIIASRDYALAEAARPAFGDWGKIFTVILAVVATISGLIASTFAVSRMLAMLTEMKLVPHRHFGMPGSVQKHTLVYTVVFAIALTLLFDLSRIASLGAIFYIVMDMAVHWGVLTRLRSEVGAKSWVLITALLLDATILIGFVVLKATTDSVILWVAGVGLLVTFAGEQAFLARVTDQDSN